MKSTFLQSLLFGSIIFMLSTPQTISASLARRLCRLRPTATSLGSFRTIRFAAKPQLATNAKRFLKTMPAQHNDQHKHNNDKQNKAHHSGFNKSLAYLGAAAGTLLATHNKAYAEPKVDKVDNIFDAIKECDIKKVREILAKDKDQVNVSDLTWDTPLRAAFWFFKEYHQKGMLEIIDLLLDSNANLKAKGSLYETSLHKAINYNIPLDVIEKMLKLGADPNVPDSSGKSPYTVAKEAGRQNLMNLLAQYGGVEQSEEEINENNQFKSDKDSSKKERSLSSGDPLMQIDLNWKTGQFENHESLQDIAGLIPEEVHTIISYLKDPELRKRFVFFKAKPYKGILLYGPPGTGKTALARAMARETNSPFFNIKMNEIESALVGESEKLVASVFKQARAAAKKSPTKTAIVFFDEFDSVARARSNYSASYESKLLNTFLSMLDGFEQDKGCHVLILASTNRKEILDPAVIRPGRFDSHIFIGLPDRNKQVDILTMFLSKVPYEHNNDVVNRSRAVSRVLHDLQAAQLQPSPADLKKIIEDSSRKAATTKDVDAITDKILLEATAKHIAQSSGEKAPIAQK